MQPLGEEHFRLAVDAAPNAILIIDDEGTIVLANQQAEHIFGHSREEMARQPLEFLIPERYRNTHLNLWRGYLKAPVKRAMGPSRELFGLRKDGAEVPLEFGLNPISSSTGEFILVSVIDITERKRAEMEMLRQRNELTHLSRVTSLGQLSGSMAHELNQPLAIILSNAEAAQTMLERDRVDIADVREILSDIVGASLRAGSVIKHIRALIKRGETRHVPMQLNDVVADVLSLIRSDLIVRGVTVHTDLAEALPQVLADPVQIQQVLINLITNACDAMADNPGPERVLVITSQRDKWLVRVTVQDRGCGLPHGNGTDIFRSFFTTKPHGLGLGLSICATILTDHHGRIWAEPNTHKGTRFCFELTATEPHTP